MSKRRPEQEIERSFANRFNRWILGKDDLICGQVEMKPQEEFHEEDQSIEQRMREKQQIREHIYDMEKNREVKAFRVFYKFMSVVFCIALIVVLLITVSYLPPNGAADRPVNNEVSARYIEKGLQETGAVNIVTGMILDYRAFDTFGESNVLFIATCTVLILMRLDKKGDKTETLPGNEKTEEAIRQEEKDWTIAQAEANDRIYEPKNDVILQQIARVLVPLIMMFGIYVVLNGHLSPGGGFSGGAIIGAGLILYLNAFGFAKTERFFTEKTYKWICFGSLSFYCIAKSYSFFMGANHLNSGIPLGTPGAILSSGLILPLNICVGLVVACTMYAFYALFRKGGF